MDSYFKSADISLMISQKCFSDSKINDNLAERLIAKCCYELQQSLEYNIKGLVLYYGDGIDFEYNHYLSGNINKVYEVKKNIDDFDKLDEIFKELDPYIVTIDAWAKEKSRYNFDFKATINSIKNISKIASKLNDYTKKLCDEANK